jgi:hypothetical protein
MRNENSLRGMPPVSRVQDLYIELIKKIYMVKVDTVYTKWSNLDENLLNGVIAVKIIELGGKNWNLLLN